MAVEVWREAVFPAPVDLGWDIRCYASVFNLVTDGIAVIALVAMQDVSLRHGVEQCVGGLAIGDLAAGQQKGNRATERIGQGVNFRGSATTRATNRLRPFPPFPPAAQRCAFTADESMSTCAGGPPAEAKA